MSIQKSSGAPQWIAIAITHSLPEAHILAGKLGAHDIPTMIHQEAGAAAIGITLGNLGEIKLLVAPGDVESAEAILYPDADAELEASTDKFQLIWTDCDGEGDGEE